MTNLPILMWTPSAGELAIILVILVLVFGLGKLPKAAKQIGASMRGFQKSLRGEDEEEDDDLPPREPKQLEAEPLPGREAREAREARSASTT